MNSQIAELIVFISAFFVPILIMVPTKYSLLVYDKNHFYKYKYIINVIYDLIGVILVPTGLTVLTDKFKNLLAILLFLICIIIFIIVAIFRYQIEVEYDNLSKKNTVIEVKRKFNYGLSAGKVTVYLYAYYFMIIPINLLYNYITQKYMNYKAIIIMLCIYIIGFVIINIILSYKLIDIIIDRLLNIIHEDNKKSFFIYCGMFLIIHFNFLGLYLRNEWKLVGEVVILAISVFLTRLSPLLNFIVIPDGNYKNLRRNLIGLYDTKDICFVLKKTNKKNVNIKYVGSLSWSQLLKLRLRKKAYFSISDKNIVSNIKEDKYAYSFILNINTLNVRSNHKINYITFIDEDGCVFYQPVTLLI